jgi:hypothetical protein
MTFKKRLLTQTQLGQLFGATSHDIGKWLVSCGLKDQGTRMPTREAHNEKYCDTAPSGQSNYSWEWVAEKTVQRLIEAGHPLAPVLPPELVEAPELTGPFQLKTADSKIILNGEGRPVMQMVVAAHAKALMRILEAAHKTGAIERMLKSEPVVEANDQ